MAIKVIKKYSTVDLSENHTISTNNIIAPRVKPFGLRNQEDVGGEIIFELIEPIKPVINIKLDANGKPNVSKIDLGIQYEHYSTWIHFDLSSLLWQISTPYNPTDDIHYEEEYYYSLYDFMLFFKDSSGDIVSWEFDGIDFKVPKEITEKVGKYEIALAIQEKRGDEEEGNLPDDFSPFDDDIESVLHSRETFISYSWTGIVSETYFTPDIFDGITGVQVTDTSQLKALIKPAIDCRLADDGYFTLEPGMDTTLGVYNDNFIRYLRFNPGKITAHLNEFYVFALFKQNDIIVPTAFEQTESGAYDDTEQPLIAWIPGEVFNSAGEWRVMIVAFSKNYHTDNKESEEYTDLFYRFLSTKITMQVEPGFIEDLKLMTDADEEYYISDFVTADEQVIIGSDNAILRGE